MVIQHNVMALNAYRYYNANTSALAKNLEKLSSGYKINSAGDDAAGLAISEKMRAQITGLEAAQKNVSDGTSLAKTAEGAMQEIQDMLNRMEYLATQSANGTYDNEVDRANLQKEVSSLRTEIDRIADSSNFNGIKLLDGSMDGATKTTYNINTSAVKTAALLPEADDNDGDGIPDTSGQVGTNTITYKEVGDPVKTSFTLDLANVNWTVDVNSMGEDDTAIFQITFPGTTMAGGTQKAVAVAFEFDKATLQSMVDENGLVDNEKLVSAIMTDLQSAASLAAGGDSNNDGIEDLWLDIAGVNTDNNTSYSGFDIVSAEGTKLTFELRDLSAATEAETQANWGNIQLKAAVVKDGTQEQPDYSETELGTWNVGTTDMVEGVLPGSDRMANTVLDMASVGFNTSDASANDGWTISIDGQDYILAVGDDSDFADYSGSATVVKVGANDDVNDQLRELANAINAGSSTWSVGANYPTGAGATDGVSSGGVTSSTKYGLTFSQIAKTDKEDLTTLNGIAAAIKTGKTTAKTSAAPGDSLTLQIGDTADTYNQMSVSISDMHSDALGIGDLDISTQEGAQAAIDVIKNAINSVSSTRGDLGAIQNRLEHTANNLSVMVENITDAESTIRDTDVAEEMMAYTKNNILVQSAQAMLAQANAVPQGVLQLLQ